MAQPSKPTSQRIVDFYEDRKHSKKTNSIATMAKKTD
jgi:hypothetical protein